MNKNSYNNNISQEYNISNIPNDLYLNTIWKILPVEDIFNLCESII